MSIAIMSRLFKLPLGSCNRKLLALRLADFADDEGRGIWPTVARLAGETEMSERSVQRTLKEFVDEGILVVVASASGRPGQATRYDFDLGALDRIAAQSREKQSTGDNLSPVENNGQTGDNPAETGDTDDRDGCHSVTRTIIEPPIEPSFEKECASEAFPEKEAGESTESPKAIERAIERAFKLWHPTWEGYADESEPKARRAWFSLTAAERREAAARSAEYQQGWKKAGRTYRLASSTYLSEKRWQKLPPKPAEPAKIEMAAPMGKAWMTNRFVIFHSPKRPMPRPVAGVQMDIDAGGERAEDAVIARHERYGWPKVHDMNEALREKPQRAWRVSPDIIAMGADFVPVEIAGPVGQAWKRMHRRMLLPWLPYEPKYAYFPPIAAGVNDLDAAVEASFWQLRERIEGHAHAAAE